jgi:NAD(P)-dependent dehydrogenase (short-subunit alcohol dehydrogenase family)
MRGELAGKAVVLTGGADGIGYECACVYVREGAAVAIIDRDSEKSEKAVAKLGSDCMALSADVGEGSAVERAIRSVLARFGRIDAVHNNADTAHIRQYLDEIHPLGTCARGDVIADAAVFLLSERSRFITGCILPVSGGAELGYRRQQEV